MKKVINDPDQVVSEMIEGFMSAYKNEYTKLKNTNGIIKKNLSEKVGIVIGGGSGHEPMFLGFVGDGLADGVAIGNVFTAPTPNTIQEVAQEVDKGKGVIFIYGNYAGDVLNFDMAGELLDFEGVETSTVRVTDDIASAPIERKNDRRGIAGDLFVIKIAGAAADKGLSLEKVTRIAQKANESTFSIGVALSPATIPDSGEPNFILDDDEIEIGMGIHGEPGTKRTKMLSADKLVNLLMEELFEESNIRPGDEVVVLVNGLGSTTQMELFIVNRKVAEILEENGIKIHDMDVNSYCTTQEMGGFSISLLKLDSELEGLYNAPAHSSYYIKK